MARDGDKKETAGKRSKYCVREVGVHSLGNWNIVSRKCSKEDSETAVYVCCCCLKQQRMLLSPVWLFVTPQTVACQATVSFTISWRLLRFMSIESVMLTISSFADLFSFCLQFFLASGSFAMSQLFSSGAKSIGASNLASVLLTNIQDWFPLGLTYLFSLLSKELWRVLSSTTIQKHQYFGTKPSLWSNSPIRTWLLEKP